MLEEGEGWVAQRCECTGCHSAADSKMVQMFSCMFYTIKNGESKMICTAREGMAPFSALHFSAPAGP